MNRWCFAYGMIAGACSAGLLFSGLVLLAGCAPDPVPPSRSSVAAAVVLVAAVEPFDTAPPIARKYRAELTRNARVVWGLDAPVAMFGAQVAQESAWDPNARSPYASGLAQFTPATADWIDDVYADLAPAQPLNPSWALRALVRYDKHLFDRISGASECDRHAFMLAAYNGGPGWVTRDQAKAATLGIDAMRYWDAVERVNAGRNGSAFAENRGYPKRIIRIIQPIYASWGRSVCT